MESRGPDNLLIEQFVNGDAGAFEEIVRRHRDKAYGLAYHMTGSREDAEDISQDAFAIVFRKASGFRGESGFKTWFYRIIVNLCRSHIRRKKWVTMLGFGMGSEDESDRTLMNKISLERDTEDAAASIVNMRLKNAIDNAVKNLPLQQREVFVMKHFHEMKISEIAAALDCAEGTIKSHLFRAVRSLQEMLKDWGDK